MQAVISAHVGWRGGAVVVRVIGSGCSEGRRGGGMWGYTLVYGTSFDFLSNNSKSKMFVRSTPRQKVKQAC